MTFQAIGRGVRRVPGGLEVKVEIQDSVTTRTVRVVTITGPTLEAVKVQLQKDLDQLTQAEEDGALSQAVVGQLLAASAPPAVDETGVVVTREPGGGIRPKPVTETVTPAAISTEDAP